MACGGCGAKYRGVSSGVRANVGTNPKYKINKVNLNKKPNKTTVPSPTPKKVDPEKAIAVLASITSSVRS